MNIKKTAHVKSHRDNSPWHKNSVIIYSTSCRSKPVWLSVFYVTQEEILWRMLVAKDFVNHWLPMFGQKKKTERFLKIFFYVLPKKESQIGLEFYKKNWINSASINHLSEPTMYIIELNMKSMHYPLSLHLKPQIQRERERERERLQRGSRWTCGTA